MEVVEVVEGVEEVVEEVLEEVLEVVEGILEVVEVVEDSSSLDVIEKESEDTEMELEGVKEGEEVVEEKSLVVKPESDVEERSCVNDELNEVGREVVNESPEDVDVKVSESEKLVGIDRENEVDGSIVMDESENELEVNTLLNSVDGVASVEVSVKVNGNDDDSPGVSVSVPSVVPVLDGNPSVIVGSPVCVSVGDRLTSEVVERGGVDDEKSVGVLDRNVGSV